MTAPEGRRTIPLAEVTLPHQCPAPVRLGVLSRSAYFHGLDAAALEGIDRRMRTATIAADEAVFRAGEEARALYVVAEGRVRMSQPTPSGALVVTDILGPGAMFGEMSSLGEPVHQRTATALVGSCVLQIGQAAFREVMVEQPVVGLRVVTTSPSGSPALRPTWAGRVRTPSSSGSRGRCCASPRRSGRTAARRVCCSRCR